MTGGGNPCMQGSRNVGHQPVAVDSRLRGNDEERAGMTVKGKKRVLRGRRGSCAVGGWGSAKTANRSNSVGFIQ